MDACGRKVLDVVEAIRNLKWVFIDNADKFEYEAERAVIRTRRYTVEECNEEATKYHKGARICEDYLSDVICMCCFLKKIKNLGLTDFLNDLKDVLPTEDEGFSFQNNISLKLEEFMKKIKELKEKIKQFEDKQIMFKSFSKLHLRTPISKPYTM
ncbi:uncharacterized protein LOC126887696 [Diabrotica virgifera virgifera]|uniref:Uncharacterized protein n=1 Tax=Diabrotica virgifera virgifera TaxID=50390 RepID=A0ABM5JXC7_DIAVI|nr:uncharacterized protein LOC126878875 [Diabrotica virgifera virgifera]XP_050497733.1 uncharacterized protein LOC126878875 [Diabrotica virgifera virgifera]XP_050499347.1 uncharacterized protein LOC126879963 [Diabrotica virgifera virgifera]XP_050499348.1 uncharacterized protein LOC126879963 [Diabrotica virgifera virgifera]XP_050502590.1 uncharacterized protein LOC126881906 [Diabrotica virgifera virgifera]XP_050511307.1 uncharacterized protein LOC126887696 [Diabrotica virgifera virgifera]